LQVHAPAVASKLASPAVSSVFVRLGQQPGGYNPQIVILGKVHKVLLQVLWGDSADLAATEQADDQTLINETGGFVSQSSHDPSHVSYLAA